MLNVTGSMADTLGKIQPFRYRGYVYDVETELYYLRSRYYSHRINRFLSPDSIIVDAGKPLSQNAFVYCSNCPLSKIDEAGLKDTYVFYYYRPTSKHPLKEQAMDTVYYDSNAKDVHMIEVGYTREFIDAWNAMDDSNLGSVYFVLHGAPNRICFDENNGEFLSCDGIGGDGNFSELLSKNVTGAIIMFNCEGAQEVNGKSVATCFAKLCKTDVYACVCGVSYNRIPYYNNKYMARETESSFINAFTSNWRLYHYSDGDLDVYTLFSKWFNGVK